MEFTKEQTNTAKGIAICLMFAHHLYGFSDRLLNGNSYIPLVPFFNAEIYIGHFGKICVSMFLFLSGYGMYLGYLRSKKTSLHYSILKIKDFYLTYWLYFLIFVPIGILFFQNRMLGDSNQIRYSTEPVIFLKNFVGWNSSYNGEWWFIRMFIITLLFMFPLYTKLIDKSIASVVLVSLFLFSISSKIDAYGVFGFIFWQTSFAAGIVLAKLKFFSSRFIEDLDQTGWIWTFSWLLLCFILRLKVHGADYDFLIAPFFIYFSIRAVATLHLSKLFAYLGMYAFPLWLIHSFFCYYYFQDIVYFPKWSPLIFILLTTLSLLSVLGIEYLRSYLLQLKRLTNIVTEPVERFWLRFKSIRR